MFEFVEKVAEGAVEQHDGAVDVVAATAAGQHGAEVFKGNEVGKYYQRAHESDPGFSAN